MKVLTTSTENQSIKFIPRKDLQAGRLILIDKDTRSATEIIPTFEKLSNQVELTASFNLTEGSRYAMTIVSSSIDFCDRVVDDNGIIEALSCVDESFYNEGVFDVVYRDTVICTDQLESDKYNAQKGEYIQADTNDNKYVIRD